MYKIMIRVSNTETGRSLYSELDLPYGLSNLTPEGETMRASAEALVVTLKQFKAEEDEHSVRDRRKIRYGFEPSGGQGAGGS
jgi:hypothetical protein